MLPVNGKTKWSNWGAWHIYWSALNSHNAIWLFWLRSSKQYHEKDCCYTEYHHRWNVFHIINTTFTVTVCDGNGNASKLENNGKKMSWLKFRNLIYLLLKTCAPCLNGPFRFPHSLCVLVYRFTTCFQMLKFNTRLPARRSNLDEKSQTSVPLASQRRELCRGFFFNLDETGCTLSTTKISKRTWCAWNKKNIWVSGCCCFFLRHNEL